MEHQQQDQQQNEALPLAQQEPSQPSLSSNSAATNEEHPAPAEQNEKNRRAAEAAEPVEPPPVQINPENLPRTAFLAALGLPDNAYVTVDANGVISVRDAGPDADPTDPRALAIIEKIDPTRHKRNCGRTGATTEIGRAIAAKNATRHGIFAKTLILKDEREEDWLELLNVWLAQYNNPAEKTVLYSFVMKTAQSEWMRLRAVREHDFCLQIHNDVDLALWKPEEVKRFELAQRYLTTAERRFQREYKLLDHHWRTYCKPAEPPKPRAAAKPALEPRPVPPPIGVYNAVTGVSKDEKGNHRPAPPNWVEKKIVPGVYDEDHPSNWRPKPQEG